MVAEINHYKNLWYYEETVEVTSLRAIDGWGVGTAVVRNLFEFAFCEIEDWHKLGDVYKLDLFMDIAAEIPVYYFLNVDTAVQFAHNTSNRYPLERRMHWLRFQSEYWFATIFTYYADTIRYLSSTERMEYIRKQIKFPVKFH